MVTVVVAAILVAIAVPSYTSQVRKSRRTDARSALLDLASREERYLSLNNAYTSDSTALGYGGGGFPITVGSGFYQITVSNVTAPAVGPPPVVAAFTLTATPISSQVKDTQCASLTVSSTGAQQSVDNNGNDTSTTCWN